MSNHDIFDDEPPPSYEEATGRPSHTHRPPPPTPPRPANNKINTNPFTPSTPGGPASPAAATPHTPHTPAQTFQQILPAASQAVRQQFPPAFNLYRDAFPGAQRTYFLGEHQSTPLYSVTAGWAATASGASLILHNGPSDDHAPLGTAAYAPAGRRMAVSLPPLPGRPPQPPYSVHTPTVMDPTFSFVVEIPSSNPAPGAAATTYHNEKFEWRRSSSGAVGGLGGRAHGWKLVRLSNELPPGGMAVAGSGPPSGDGHEVVAVCTESVMSVSKMWKFSFLGTGLSRALGEQWAVMAVLTGLVIWDNDRRRD